MSNREKKLISSSIRSSFRLLIEIFAISLYWSRKDPNLKLFYLKKITNNDNNLKLFCSKKKNSGYDPLYNYALKQKLVLSAANKVKK